MALRNIRTIGDEILRKEAKSVKAMTPRTEKLIEDMLDTMYDAYGVGLAAPQVRHPEGASWLSMSARIRMRLTY